MKNLLASKKFYLASSEEIPCKGGRLVGYRLKENKYSRNDFSIKGVTTSTTEIIKGVTTSTIKKVSQIAESVFVLKTKQGNYITSISADSSTLWLITPEKPVVGQDMKNCLKLTWCGKEYYSQPHRTEMVLDTLKVSNKIYLAATRRKIYICYIADM